MPDPVTRVRAAPHDTVLEIRLHRGSRPVCALPGCYRFFEAQPDQDRCIGAASIPAVFSVDYLFFRVACQYGRNCFCSHREDSG